MTMPSLRMSSEHVPAPAKHRRARPVTESWLDRVAESRLRWAAILPAALILAAVSFYPVASMFALWPRYAELAAHHRQPIAFEVTVVDARDLK